MNLFDLHCDTPLEMYKSKQKLSSNLLHISLERAFATFDKYIQIMDIWSDKRLSDEECFNQFQRVHKYFCDEAAECRDVSLVTSLPATAEKATVFLGVEDARLLGGEVSRLDVLYRAGVRFLTFMWAGTSCIGGSHNTKYGLTDFGKEILHGCFEGGIIPDISHASEQASFEMLDEAHLCGKPIIATHSNSKAICDHTRNLSDALFCSVVKSGGIVGISLCPEHLSDPPEDASVTDIIRHIDHYLSLGGENAVCLGCDLDGTDLPLGVDGIEDLPKIAVEMQKIGYDEKLIDKILYLNAYNFVKNNLR